MRYVHKATNCWVLLFVPSTYSVFFWMGNWANNIQCHIQSYIGFPVILLFCFFIFNCKLIGYLFFLFSIYKCFIRIYLLYGGFIVTIPIRLMLYISYIVPIVSIPQPPPGPTLSNCKRFLCSTSYRYMNSINATH
jgi:hypothetical protein